MTWGVWGKNYNTSQMVALINCCVDTGITSFDHADIYGDYTTESAFGKAFKESKLDRTSIQFISKCGIQMLSKTRKTFVKHYQYNSDYIIHSVETSLKNLQSDYLDLLLLHRPSPLMNVHEIAEAVDKLTSAGKILKIGVSNFSAAETDLILTKINIAYNQIEFSITHFEAMLNGSLAHLQTKGIVPMCWSPLGTVFKNDTIQSSRIKELLVTLSVKYNVTDYVILLSWIMKHPAGILPVCGTADIARIKNLMNATTVLLDLQDWFALWQASIGEEVA